MLRPGSRSRIRCAEKAAEQEAAISSPPRDARRPHLPEGTDPSPSGQPGLSGPVSVRNIGGRLKVGAARGVSNCATGHDVPAFRSPVLDRVRASIPQDQQAPGRDLDGAFVRPKTGGVAGGVREPTHHRWTPPRTSMHRQRRGRPLTSTTRLPAHPIGRSPDVAKLARSDPNISLHPPPALAAEPGGS